MLNERLHMRDQKESTCGAYAAVQVLRARGFIKHSGRSVDENYVAKVARVNVSSHDLEERAILLAVRKAGKRLSDERVERLRVTTYRYPLPVESDSVRVGCSPEGVKYAIEKISGGKLCAIPIIMRDRAKGMSLPRFRALTADLADKTQEWDFNLILNLRCSRLLDATRPGLVARRFLAGPAPGDARRTLSWQVGHFVNVGGLLTAKYLGGRTDTYYLILDSYKELGVEGIHIQPVDYVWRALRRGDGREGGLLIALPDAKRDSAVTLLRRLGCEISLWNNGSPFCASE
jgi:hypothetical protein